QPGNSEVSKKIGCRRPVQPCGSRKEVTVCDLNKDVMDGQYHLFRRSGREENARTQGSHSGLTSRGRPDPAFRQAQAREIVDASTTGDRCSQRLQALSEAIDNPKSRPVPGSGRQ